MELANRRVLLTGCAGFIGSHLVDRLLEMGCDVLGVDDLSAGKEEFMTGAMANPRFRFEKVDLLRDNLSSLLEGREVLCHFAANPDVRKGVEDTRVHLDQNVEVTYRLLEGSRRAGVGEILFPSTSTVYGETVVPTPETQGPLLPISLYGASKLACEALVSGFCHSFDMRAVIYRFANVVGPRSTHNVLHDFLLKLSGDPEHLEILGREPGTSKSYIHVSDCVDAMVAGAKGARERVEVFNIGTCDRTDVREIADIVVEEKDLKEVEYRWTGGVQDGRGWVGDVRVMQLAIDKLEATGWSPSMNSSQAIRKAVREIIGKE
jgi:UDP-glucose 4-epimerase